MTVEKEKVERFIRKVKKAFKDYDASGDLKKELKEVIKEIEDHELEINNPVPTILPVCKYLEEACNNAPKKSS